jgi:hypothetical protein
MRWRDRRKIPSAWDVWPKAEPFRYQGPPLEEWQPMSRDNSPNYAQGAADALEDMELVAQHGGVALGARPNDPNYPVMYMKGYMEHYAPKPHRCTSACQRGSAQWP